MAIESALSLHTRNHRKAILVVDDDVSLRAALAEWFRLSDYTVYEATTADEAVTLLRSPLSIDLVITDIDMPGTMNGLGLVDFIGTAAPRTPVIVVSGEEQQSERHDLVFFRKPYDLQAVSSLIGNILITTSSEAEFE